MVHNRLFWVVSSICLVSLCTAPLFGQAAFSLSSSPATGADIGIAELAGQISLSVVAGTTVAAPLIIQYSAPITNNHAVEIHINGTGGLAGIAPVPSLLSAENSILIDVPAGGNIGDTIRIRGVRVALAGGNFTSVSATVSSPTGAGNGIAAGQGSVIVINSILPPFSVDVTSTPPLSFTRGTVTNGTSSFMITEGYSGAFTDGVGIFGQTLPTTIRITPYPELPPGVSVTFIATASSSSGGVLTTTSGEDEKIPRQDGSTEVIYQYVAGGGSNSQVQSFTISVSLTLTTTSDTGVVNFQLALIPIGIVAPNNDFPSKDIPRYSERLVPDQSHLPGVTGSVLLAFPFRAQSDATYTGIALTNILSAYVNVTLTPFDSTGAPILGPKIVTIPPKSQMAKLATDVDIFGPNFNVAKAGTILAEGNTPILPGFYLLGDFNGSKLDGATADMSLLRYWVWPVIFRQAPSPFTILELFNPNSSAGVATLTLYSSNGTIISTVLQNIPVSGTMARAIQQLFPLVNFDSFSGGYVMGQSDVPLLARETFGNSLDSNVLPGQVSQSINTFYWPHYASGGGLTTELTFVNLDSTMSANITVALMDKDGNSLGQAPISIPPLGQAIETISHLFPALPSSQVTTGYLRVDLLSTHIGPFVFTPSITGSLRFSVADGSGSAALSLTSSLLTDFVYSHVAETAGYYTGIAMLNTNADPATISLEVFTGVGVSVGTTSFTLQPGQKIAMLLHELVPAAAGQSGGYIHIQSDKPVSSFSLFGSNNGLSLSAIPPQDLNK
jgi:hypothetical protein